MLMSDSDKSGVNIYQLQLKNMNINIGDVHRNLPIPTLIELAIQRNEGILSRTGALAVKTGKFTGRSPDDRYIVDDVNTHNLIDWILVIADSSWQQRSLVITNHLIQRIMGLYILM